MIKDLRENQKALVLSTIGFLIAAAIFLILMQLDSTQILGINRWIKPIKFAISSGIFLFTIAVYLQFLQGFRWSKKVIAYGTLLIMIAEVSLVVMQAARGTTSHFNVAKDFDGIVFASMGLMILTNTFLVVYLTFLYFRSNFTLSKPIVWGMRFGLILFLIGSIEGGYMSAQMAHSVGVADGGSGLPFANWSTIGGDLRVAHFFGLHSLQIMPMFAVFSDKYRVNSASILTAIFAIVYFAAISLMFYQALLGKPFLSL